MRKVYDNQKTQFTCGVASLRNCLASLGRVTTEHYLRQFTKTSRKKGTSPKGILRALKKLGYEGKEIKNHTYEPFVRRLKRQVKQGNPIILLTDHEDHYVAIINYSERKFYILDPQRDQPLNKFLTAKEMGAWCNNFSKKKRKTYYYAIIVKKGK